GWPCSSRRRCCSSSGCSVAIKAGTTALDRSYYERLLFPALRRIDPETAHDRTLNALELAQSNPAGRAMLRAIAGDIPARPVQVGRLHFPNPLGIAAGFDKDARVVRGLAL